MTASKLLSTDVVAPRDRAPQWCEWISRHFCGLQSDLYGDTDFDGVIDRRFEGATPAQALSGPQTQRALCRSIPE